MFQTVELLLLQDLADTPLVVVVVLEEDPISKD
jgi:hypothetical protein